MPDITPRGKYTSPALTPLNLKGVNQSHLTQQEAHSLLNSTPAALRQMQSNIDKMPTTSALQLLARMGEGHRMWYQDAKKTLEETFGDEAPRFIALLAATSSRKGVKDNMRVAAQLWKHYKTAEKQAHKEDRELTSQDIRQVVQRSHQEREQLGLGYTSTSTSDLPNILIALNPNIDPGDATTKILAKPSNHKIDSFRKNLLGNLQAVTNDAWIGHMMNKRGSAFKGKEGAEYGVYSAKVREVAKTMGWEPAEAQAALWQAYRQLAITSNRKKLVGSGKSPTKTQSKVLASNLKEQDITGGAAFHTLLNDPEVVRHLGDKATGTSYIKQIKERMTPVTRPADMKPYRSFTPQEKTEVEPLVTRATKKFVPPHIVHQGQKQGSRVRYASRPDGSQQIGSPYAPEASEMPQGGSISPPTGQTPFSAIGVSPSVNSGLSYEQASERTQSGNQKAFNKVIKSINEHLGIKSKVQDAVGDWEGEAENSIYQQVDHPEDPSKIEYAAAWYGLLANQKAVLVFHASPQGTDSLYHIQLPPNGPMADVSNVRQALDKAGIKNRTIIPDPKGNKVVYLDQGRADRDKIQQFIGVHGGTVSESSGQGNFIGGNSNTGDTRTHARAVYRKIIDSYEAKHGTGDQPSSVQTQREALLRDNGSSSSTESKKPFPVTKSNTGDHMHYSRRKMSRVQAPPGGAVIRGVNYTGGKVIPNDALQKYADGKSTTSMNFQEHAAKAYKGDAQAGHELMAGVRPILVAHLKGRGLDQPTAEDATQDTLLNLWKHLKSGQPQPDNYINFAMTSASNNHRDKGRRGKVRGSLATIRPQEEGIQRETTENPVEDAISKERNEGLNNAISGLQGREKTAVSLWREGKTLKEIGQVLGMHLGSADRYLKSGLAKIKDQVQHYSKKRYVKYEFNAGELATRTEDLKALGMGRKTAEGRPIAKPLPTNRGRPKLPYGGYQAQQPVVEEDTEPDPDPNADIDINKPVTWQAPQASKKRPLNTFGILKDHIDEFGEQTSPQHEEHRQEIAKAAIEEEPFFHAEPELWSRYGSLQPHDIGDQKVLAKVSWDRRIADKMRQVLPPGDNRDTWNHKYHYLNNLVNHHGGSLNPVGLHTDSAALVGAKKANSLLYELQALNDMQDTGELEESGGVQQRQQVLKSLRSMGFNLK